jgi:hypothetical protein
VKPVKAAFDSYLEELNRPLPDQLDSTKHQEIADQRREMLITLIFEMAKNAEVKDLSRENISNVYLPQAQAIEKARQEAINEALWRLLNGKSAVNVISHMNSEQYSNLIAQRNDSQNPN